MEMKKVGVIGAGQMGSGIALIIAQAGIEVVIRDIEQGFVDKGLNSIKKIVKKNVDKEKITQQEADSILSRITGTLELSEAGKDADMIIEAIIENMDLKKSLFKELDELCPDKTIFATNTSSLSITEIASVTKRQAQFFSGNFHID